LLEVTQEVDVGKKAGVSFELPMVTKKVVNVLSSQWLNTSFTLILVSFYSHLPVYEDGTDRMFRNVGI